MSNNYFRYLNQKCPVCEKEFNGEDDIVVCPLCGTPHHRECYKKNGECGNFDQHSKGFRWTPEEKGQPVSEPVKEQPINEGNPVYSSQQAPTTAFFGSRPDPLSLFPKEIEDGVATEEVAEFVQLNAFKYIQNFFYAKSKKNTFSWSAFLLAPYWFFYRKLHKIGAILLAIMVASSIIFSLPSASEKLSEDLYNFVIQYENIEQPETEEDAEEFLTEYRSGFVSVFKNNVAGTVLLVSQLGVLLAIHLFAGFRANKMYYNHTIKSIRKIKAETPDENQRKLLYFKQGGISVSATVLAVLSYEFVMMAVSYLFQYI